MIKQKVLGPLEHQIMDIVWKQKKATVYSVVEELCQEKKLAYTTVMTVMSRLTKKGVLSREKKGKTFYYHPRLGKEKFIHSLVQNTIAKMIDTFGEEALVAFIDETKNLSQEHRQQLLTKLNDEN
ncbi:MAG: penicillinase repressor [Patescibacteria group bacterium]|nr:MAG: penicillinase repressor [Patescibacteria group bacterium]